MCFRRIYDKIMSQFRTYNQIGLAERLVRSEQNLTELNANQIYFMNSVAGFEVEGSTNTFNATRGNDGYGMYYAGWNGFLTFTGDKPNKDVIIVPKFVAYDSSGNVLDFGQAGGTTKPQITFCSIYKTGDRSNVCKAFLQVEAFYYNTNVPFSKLKIWVVANDTGILTIEPKTYVFNLG